jgi:hypothetical protein
MKTINRKENTKEKLGGRALLVIMEPATESQSSRAYKQHLRSPPSNKINVLLDSGSNEDLYFLPKGNDKPFPYLTRQTPKSWCTSFPRYPRSRRLIHAQSFLFPQMTPIDFACATPLRLFTYIRMRIRRCITLKSLPESRLVPKVAPEQGVPVWGRPHTSSSMGQKICPSSSTGPVPTWGTTYIKKINHLIGACHNSFFHPNAQTPKFPVPNVWFGRVWNRFRTMLFTKIP